MRPFEALFEDGAHPADDGAGHGPALVVEVRHDDDEALVFFAEEVGYGDLGGVEFDVGGRGGGGVGGLDEFGFDGGAARDEDDGEALGGLTAGYEIVGVWSSSVLLCSRGSANVFCKCVLCLERTSETTAQI